MHHAVDSTYHLFRTVRGLDAGLNNHDAWLKSLHQVLVCDGPHENPDDLSEQAHRLCRFGQWYYGEQPEELRCNQKFQQLGELHKGMHAHARGVLIQKLAQQPVPVPQYDAFISDALTFKLEVRNFQFELMSQVCSVDHLTGAWNRHAMMHRLGQEHERLLRNGEPACLCLMDLDHFKAVNDGHGHPAGDQVLRQVIAFASKQLRNYDSIFRYGGEEFLFCLPNSDEEVAVSVIERLRQGLAELPIILPGGESITITASFGIARMEGEQEIEMTIQQADNALLCAKARGRDRSCVWSRIVP